MFDCKARALYLLLILLALAALPGCGKKEWPVPDNSARVFAWQNVQASQNAAGCLSISGAIVGNYQNLQALVLEVQPFDLSCENCPFVAVESQSFTPDQINLANGRFSFSYCPTFGLTPYRWRIIGHNSQPGLPPVQTPARIVGDLALDF